MLGLESEANVQTRLMFLFMSAVEVVCFGKGSVQSRHWLGQVLPPVLLDVLRRGHQLRQHISGVNQICVIEGLGIAVEGGDSIVTCFGSNPLVPIGSRDGQPGSGVILLSKSVSFIFSFLLLLRVTVCWRHGG